jgi:hypothetical protein
MTGLLRYQIFIAYGVALLSLWYGTIQNKDSILIYVGKVPFSSQLPTLVKDTMIDFLPIYFLLGLAIYAAGSVVIGVINFSDCPDAAAEVDRHVKEARAALKQRKIIL